MTSIVFPQPAEILRTAVLTANTVQLQPQSAKTERKKFMYSEGIKNISRMVLHILDKAGIYHTSLADRDIDVIFPSPLPENMMEKLKEAQIKRELGVPTRQVLRKLGY